MPTDERSLVVIALVNRLVDTGAEPLRSTELWELLNRVADPTELRGRSENELAELLGDRDLSRRVTVLLDTGVTLALRLQALGERGIWALTPFDEGFPSHLRRSLGASAPAVLYGAGDPELLKRKGLGIIGLSADSPDLIELGRAVARLATDHRLPLVTGVEGPEHQVTDTAIDSGGRAVVVSASPLTELLARSGIRRRVLRSELCVCTPYAPDVRRSVGREIGCVRVIGGLARLVLVISPAANLGRAVAGTGSMVVWSGVGAPPAGGELIAGGAAPVDDLADLASMLVDETGPG